MRESRKYLSISKREVVLDRGKYTEQCEMRADRTKG